ncbi:MAG: hypothetical protein K9M07_04795 [Simkaniaceae bacterium]|nr:hypothetical protein [Simkaniaceae bacterium]
MKKISFLVLLVFIGVACRSTPELKKVPMTFSLDAEEIHLVITKPGMQQYKMILKKPMDEVFSFEGSPMQAQTVMSLEQFYSLWTDREKGLYRTPARAVLIAYVADKKGHISRQALLLKLSNPEYNKEKAEFYFEATPLHEVNPWIIGHPVHPADLIIQTQST